MAVENSIEVAAKFLLDPDVQAAPERSQVKFLRLKGLSDEHIRDAFAAVGRFLPDSSEPSSPLPVPRQQQQHQLEEYPENSSLWGTAKLLLYLGLLVATVRKYSPVSVSLATPLPLPTEPQAAHPMPESLPNSWYTAACERGNES
eukprot:RCo049953